MPEKIRGKYFVEGETLKLAEDFQEFVNHSGLSVYEVLRVISGLPLFVEEHLDRLQNSIRQSGVTRWIDSNKLYEKILWLINENLIEEGNIKIVIHFEDQSVTVQLFFIPHKYPTAEDYLNGVPVGVLEAERINPEAKTVQAGIRETANKMIETKNLYEVLLVDNYGYIREGSRSNVFFIKDDQVVTPPHDLVLNGITRQKVVAILRSGKYDFKEKSVTLDELNSFNCIFLTGTSPKVLPICSVEDRKFNPQNQICNIIAMEYNRLIQNYLNQHR